MRQASEHDWSFGRVWQFLEELSGFVELGLFLAFLEGFGFGLVLFLVFGLVFGFILEGFGIFGFVPLSLYMFV